MEYRLGTVGFSYHDWAGSFYPRDLRPSDYLSFYARYFDTVELDTTFHAVPEAHLVSRWAASVPENFCFCVKAPASITHGPKLDEQVAPMQWFVEVMRGLGEKLGVVLLQFPPSFGFTQFDRLSTFLSNLPADARYALEFRDASWLRDETTALLREHRCCWAVGDYDHKPPSVRITTDFLFIRWIGQHRRFEHLDREQIDTSTSLEWWKSQLQQIPPSVQRVWGFMNNDYSGYAIATCNRMKRLLGLPAQEPKPADRGELFG